MPALHEQEQDLPNSHPVRGEAVVPRTAFNEHRYKALHQEIERIGTVKTLREPADGSAASGRFELF